MKIAIMGAMLEEIEPFLTHSAHEPLLANFRKTSKLRYGGNTYHEGKYKDLDIVLAYSKIGKVNATLTAATLLEKFGADMLLFTGVAGAVNSALSIGDLVAATALCQHDLDISIFGHPHGFVPEGAVYVKPATQLLALADRVAKAKGVALRHGIIATGDQFIASSERKAWVAQTFQADAIEMEGAAVAVVCDALEVPFFILRAISDAADMEAQFDFDAFLKESAKISSSFVIAMLEELSHG
ncbi:5'-methylthioadenosine/adenosylhomocysteine nucleosidase [Sulfurospirillum sp. T05]|uniref:adenosylhomocysteine nucleosidase n=1 Tax=Sulfurospirillum tamanense TaxID=2813362 RepID=A0ABS2WQ31_9BACT|nr:5'-methylthioadenosine/adenosylhomocysteine nucleosidase [Sulfurospirillum tamanensis]MBN2963680.1 5'-methylthioadenosine/adenosylhomocysteine nucleosidase [Sulfurospirillum tamanensis]